MCVVLHRTKERKRNRCGRQQKILQLPGSVHVAGAFYVFSFSRLFFLSLNDAKHAIAIKSVDITLTHTHSRAYIYCDRNAYVMGFLCRSSDFIPSKHHCACYHRVINYSSKSRFFLCFSRSLPLCASFLFQLVHVILFICSPISTVCTEPRWWMCFNLIHNHGVFILFASCWKCQILKAGWSHTLLFIHSFIRIKLGHD